MNITKHFIPDLKVISVLGSPEELPLRLSINHPDWQRDDCKIWSLDQAYFASLNETFSYLQYQATELINQSSIFYSSNPVRHLCES